MILARAPRARLEVVLEVRVAAADLDDAVERRRRERRAAEIGVDQDAGGVEHAPQRRRVGRRELRERRLDEIARIAPRADLLARALERGPGRRRARAAAARRRAADRRARGRRKGAIAAKAPQPEV